MFVQDTKNDLSNLPLPNKSCCKKVFRNGQMDFKCDDCIIYYLRGIFMKYGTISDPDKSYHLEIITDSHYQMESLYNILSDNGLEPKKIIRKNNYIVYYKESEMIVDFLNLIGANKSAFYMLNTKIRKEIRNNANRLANCDTANIDKTVSAANNQINAIKKLISDGIIDNLSEELKETAYLRLDNSDITLSELAELHVPPISKSGVNHRLKKLTEIAKNGG